MTLKVGDEWGWFIPCFDRYLDDPKHVDKVVAEAKKRIEAFSARNNVVLSEPRFYIIPSDSSLSIARYDLLCWKADVLEVEE